ncbi:T9SS type A sorting domain-containing protein [Lewinella sp. 4G2]|uniref:T9SS type A sorting domain-containing protein n=1 Tax=Lewinella sp. 4G2 TaxID=1803372 RepID=UPI0007B48B47|nr:T9SS type A sorting domain-containing protein [Lewinella sp. 4G2]OAV43774.1 hypothetical protein A3850_004355 [Lewinella sp. 4G2]
MKFQNYLPLLLLLLTSPITAQSESWTHLQNQYFYSFDGGGQSFEPFSLTVDRDTMINDTACVVMVPSEANYEFLADIIIYAEGDIVYRYADGQFWKLYDFSLDVGDTYDVYVPEETALTGFPTFISVRVDSVELRAPIRKDSVRAQYLNTFAGNTTIFRWYGWSVEFLGNIETYFVPFSEVSCDNGCPNGQVCYNMPQVGAAQGDHGSPCDTLGASVNYQNVSSEMKVSPNPIGSNRRVTVTLTSNLATRPNARLSVIDGSGRVVQAYEPVIGDKELTLNLSGLAQGIYYLEWSTSSERGVRRIVVGQ